MILGYLTIFQNCQASSTFEALNSTWLLICQRDVRPLFELRWRPRAFWRVSTGDSDILSSSDMNDEHAWSLCRNLAFFRIRASRGPFCLKHKTQAPSHIHIPKGKLLLMHWWNDGLPLHSKAGNQLSSPDNMGCPDLSSCCYTEIDVPIDLRWVSQRISGWLQRKSSHLLYMMWNMRWLWIQWRGNVLHLELIWGTPIYCALMRWHQCSSLVVTVFLGILFSSIRVIEAP